MGNSKKTNNHFARNNALLKWYFIKNFRNAFPKTQGKDLKAAGVGIIYEAKTVKGKTLTSCMTDQNGPKPGNFRPCQFYEVGAIIQTNMPQTFTRSKKIVPLTLLSNDLRKIHIWLHISVFHSFSISYI